MQIFKTFFKLLNQEKGQVIMYFCIFVGISSIVAASTSATKVDEYEKRKIKVAVMDEDQSELSKGITAYVKDNHKLVEVENDKDSINDALYWRDIEYVIEIPAGFEDAVMESKAEGTVDENKISLQTRKMEETENAAFMDQDLGQYVSLLDSYLNCGYSVKDALKKSNDSLSHKATVSIAEQDQDTANNRSAVSYYFAYVPFALMSIAIMSISMIMMYFHNEEIKKRSICSSTSLKSQNGQMTLASFVFMLVLMVLITAAIVIATKGEAIQSVGFIYYFGNIFAFGLVSLAVAFMVGNFVKSQVAVSGACNIFNLGMCFLGGVFVPLEVLPKGVINVSRFLPTYWYTQAVDEIAYMTNVNHDFLGKYAEYIGIELLFALLFLAVGLVISKRRTIFG